MKTIHLLSVVALAASASAAQALPNPASVFCLKQSGTSINLTDASGNQYGYCKIGRAMIDEWTLYHAAALGITKLSAVDNYLDNTNGAVGSTGTGSNPASIYCSDIGGESIIMSDSAGNQYGVCQFSDPNSSSSAIEEWTLFRGKNGIGNARLTAILEGNGKVGSSRP